MFSRVIVSGIAGTLVATCAFADTVAEREIIGESLAWSVAGTSSCTTIEFANSEFRTEVVRSDADHVEIIAALQVLVADDAVCGVLSSYAAEMLLLSEQDRDAFDRRISAEDSSRGSAFQIAVPEGRDGGEASVILAAANDVPPQSSGSQPTASSDYQE